MRKNIWTVFTAVLSMMALTAGMIWADTLTLKNGTRYHGKFVRGDGNIIEFRTDERIESFRTSDVESVTFKEPELVAAPATKTATQVPPTSSSSVVPSVTFPEGTNITIRTTSVIDTEKNKIGDTFSATLEDPLMMGSQVVLPRGTEIRGVISESKESGRLRGKSELALELKEILADGKTYAVRTGEYSEVGSSRGAQTAKTAGGVAALGAVIGAIAGGGKGAAIGAVSGAAAGAGVQLLIKGETLKIPVETLLQFTLQSNLTVPMR